MKHRVLFLLAVFMIWGVVGNVNAAVPNVSVNDNGSSTTGGSTGGSTSTTTVGLAAVSYVNTITNALKTTLTASIDAKENASNKTTTISSSSTDTQYPSAHAVYSAVSNRVDTASSAVQTMAGRYTVSGSLFVPDQPLPTE